MTNLSVNIKSNEKSYPIFIEDEDTALLKEKILSFVEGRNFLVIISEKVEKLYGKTLKFPKENVFK